MQINASGKILLQYAEWFHEEDPNVLFFVVAEADGSVRSVLAQSNNKTCRTFLVGVGDDTFGLKRDDGEVEGWFGGGLGEWPTMSEKWPVSSGKTSSWWTSRVWKVRQRGLVWAQPWKGGEWAQVYNPSEDPDHQVAAISSAADSAVFVEVGGLTSRGVSSWTPAEGTRPLLRWYGDFTRGAGNFHTDGKDMVWTYGEGKTPDGEIFPKRTIMTAPFSADPQQAQAKARALRPDPAMLGPWPYVVGCGYAAHAFQDPVLLRNKFIIVRLSDGVMWEYLSAQMASEFNWEQPLGITCDELFTVVGVGTLGFHITRIRLDSLGPGIPPPAAPLPVCVHARVRPRAA